MGAYRSWIRRADASGVPVLLIRVLLGALFVYMGVKKIGDPIAFLKQVRLYEALPETPPHFLNATAIILPWVEAVCGVALILGLWIRGAAALVALMLCVFTPAIFIRAMALHHTAGTPFLQIAFDCGCGTGVVIIWKKLLANAGLLILAFLAFLSQSRRFSLTLRLDRVRATPVYCRRCGYAVPRAAGGGLCATCQEPGPAPVTSPDTTI